VHHHQLDTHANKTVKKDTWCKGKVISTLFLDVNGAFPSIDINTLIHNMRKRGIPQEYMEWRDRKLENQPTTLSFENYQMAMFIVVNGLDQGDPFSGICYLIYNTDLTKMSILRLGKWILLFIDDAVIIVIRKDFAETHANTCDIMNHVGGIFEWARDHNCEFGIEEFQLLNITGLALNHLNHKKRIPMLRQTLVLGDKHIPSKDTTRFLGVIVNNKMHWKEQCATVLVKGQDWLIQFGRLTQTSQGIHASYIWQLYLSITVPCMLYAANVIQTTQQNIGKGMKNG
jgi:Reverse transcriptase (RNA-dependent DNA polymerase)